MRNPSLRPSVLDLAMTLVPGPSPRGGEASLYPTVLRVPEADYKAFMGEVVARYQTTLATFLPKAVLRSARAPHPRAVSDARLAEMIWHTAVASMATREIDEGAAAAFAPLLDAEPGKRWLVCDLTCMGNARGKLLPGTYVAPTRTLLEETDGDPVVRAIDLDGALVRPTDGRAWELASLFVRQGFSHAVVMASHPRHHFPYDTINAVTRRLLPPEHIVRQLIEPHCFIQLALNFGVLYSNRSVARNHQDLIYTPFCTTEEGQFALVRAGWKGVPRSSVWKPYRYPLTPYATPGPFGDFCRHYDGVLRAHVRRVLDGVDPADPSLLAWADEIAANLPGFPGAFQMLRPGALAEAVGTMVSGVSVVHSSEHFTYSTIGIDEAPLRLRVPPSTGPDAPPFRYEDLTTRRDVFRQHLAHELFFKVFPVRRLAEVEYRFDDERLRVAGERLRRELVDASRSLPGREYLPLNMIASSLQY